MIAQFFLQTIVGRTIIGYLLMFVVPLILPALFIKLIGFKGLRHLFSYEPQDSLIHRLDPRLKVIYPVVLGILSVMLNWNYVYFLLAFALVPWLFLRITPTRLRIVLTMVGVPAIGLIWSQGLFHTTGNVQQNLIFAFPPTISWFGTPGLSSSGLIYGLQQAGRVMVSAAASLILLYTTRPSEIIWAFYKFHLPAAVGLAFTAALRFLPQLIERLTMLLQVMQVRGYDLSTPHWWEVYAWPGYLWRVVACIPIVTVPLLIGSLRATSVMAMVADARAFGSHNKRNVLKEHQVTLTDCIAWSLLIALTITVLLLVILHVGNRQIYG